MAQSALIISNFPIIASTATAALRSRYSIIWCGWDAVITDGQEADIVIADVTDVPAELARAVGARLATQHLLICTLHANEVHLFSVQNGVLRRKGALESLLELAA